MKLKGKWRDICKSKLNYDCLTASHEIGTTLPCDDVGGRMEFVQYNRLKYDCILASALMGPATIFIVCDSIQQGDWKTAAFLAVMLLAAMACPWWGWRVMKKSVIHIGILSLSTP